MKCTVKKTLIKEKRKEENEGNKMTYSELTQIRLPQHPTQTLPPPSQPTYNITPDDTLKINICVAHAQYRQLENQGSYAEDLNKILKAKQTFYYHHHPRHAKLTTYIHRQNRPTNKHNNGNHTRKTKEGEKGKEGLCRQYKK